MKFKKFFDYMEILITSKFYQDLLFRNFFSKKCTFKIQNKYLYDLIQFLISKRSKWMDFR